MKIVEKETKLDELLQDEKITKESFEDEAVAIGLGKKFAMQRIDERRFLSYTVENRNKREVILWIKAF